MYKPYSHFFLQYSVHANNTVVFPAERTVGHSSELQLRTSFHEIESGKEWKWSENANEMNTKIPTFISSGDIEIENNKAWMGWWLCYYIEHILHRV